MNDMKKPATVEQFLEVAPLAGLTVQEINILKQYWFETKIVPISIYDIASREKVTPSRISFVIKRAIEKFKKIKD